MSLTDLQTQLQSQVSSTGGFTLNAATITSAGLTPAAGLDTLIAGQLLLTSPLTVQCSSTIPAPVGNTLSVTGTASFLQLTDLAVTVVFTLENDGTTDVLLSAALPSEWNWADCFPFLQGIPFSYTALNNASMILTTAADASYSSQDQTITLSVGLNIAGTLGLGAPLNALNVIFADTLPDSLPLWGTIDSVGTTSNPAPPGMPLLTLAAPIPLAMSSSLPFTFADPQFQVTSNIDTVPGTETNSNATRTVSYWFAVACSLETSSTLIGTVSATFYEGMLTFALTPVDGITVDTVGSMLGITIADYIPTELNDAFEIISLTGMTIGLTLSPLTFTTITADLAAGSGWQMGDFNIPPPTMKIKIANPGSSTPLISASFEAQATALLPGDGFSGTFDVQITVDSNDELTVTARYEGNISLGDVLVDLCGLSSSEIPSIIADFTLTEFNLGFSKDGSNYTYQLACMATETFPLTVAGQPLDASLQVLVDSSTNSYTVIGGLQVADSIFQVEMQDTSNFVLSATWTALPGEELGIEQIASALGLQPPSIPANLDLGLVSAGISYDLTGSLFVMAVNSANYGAAVFAADEVNGSWQFYFLLDINQKFDLSNLPLVGKELASIETVSASGFQVYIGSAGLSGQEANAINNVVTSQFSGQSYPAFPAAGSNDTVQLSATIQFGSQTLPISIPLGGNSSNNNSNTALVPHAPRTLIAGDSGSGSVTSNTSSDGTNWFTVQKSFGPVSIQKVGVLYQSSTQALWFEIDASLTLGPLTFDLMGLGFGSPLTSFSPEFSLQGLGISYSSPPLTIAGELMNLQPPGSSKVEFAGGLMIGTGEFTVQVFGFYGNNEGFTSMFVFGDIAYDFGGPPAFFVTGIALGFGYNSNVTIPTIDQVATFPFVEVLPTSTVPNTGALGGANAPPLSVLQTILQDNWVTEVAGDLWFAAGITFTSFELVNSQALILIDTGSDLVIALVGTSRASFPQGETEYVYANIELDLLVRIAPDEGVFSLQAVLASSSFVIDPACVLTGGFAFFVWFGNNPNAGDFVLTLGGYNPGFTPPSYYPSVPTVGFHWTLDSNITIHGGAYFALTPAVLMVGGFLKATYQSGNLNAWFDAHADAIIRWKPFSFNVDIGITIGASYTMNMLVTTATISIELGCDLQFWGPPTGGTLTANWNVITFTVNFGSSNTDSPAVHGWSDVEQMLPNTNSSGASTFAQGALNGGPRDSDPVNVLTLKPAFGLTPNGTAPPSGSSDTSQPWIVRGGSFAFSTTSSIPITTATIGVTAPQTVQGASSFSVFPLIPINSAWSAVTCDFAVTIVTFKGQDQSFAFGISPVIANVPASLWGAMPVDSDNNPQIPAASEQLVANQLTGLTLSVLPPMTGSSSGAIDVAENLASVSLEIAGATLPLSVMAQPAGDQPQNATTSISTMVNSETGIASATVVAARAQIFGGLVSAGYGPAYNDDMAAFAAAIPGALSAECLLVS